MGSVTILDSTTKNPISKIGQRAGVCWGSDISSDAKNFKRGIECIENGHGRTLEFVDIEMVLDGYSARVIREWYTHIGGSPTRLQESTRYVGSKNFKYVTPPSIERHDEAVDMYNRLMSYISDVCVKLEEIGIPREDSAMVLPLAMETKIVDKRNLRNLIDMSHQRLCTRAYWEYRELFSDVKNALSEYSDEWKIVADRFFVPKCEFMGYCPESKSCGRMNKKG